MFLCILEEENERKKLFQNKILVYNLVLLFYMEAIYLQVLKAIVHEKNFYENMQINHLWPTQMYL